MKNISFVTQTKHRLRKKVKPLQNSSKKLKKGTEELDTLDNGACISAL